MPGQSVTVVREIISEPEEVWGILTNLERSARVLTAVMSIRRIDGPPGFAVGTRYRETRLVLGGHVTEEFTVTDVVDGHSATIEADVPGGHLKIQYRVHPSSFGTRLEAEANLVPVESGVGKKIFNTVAGGRAVKVTREMLEQDLSDIAAYLRK